MNSCVYHARVVFCAIYMFRHDIECQLSLFYATVASQASGVFPFWHLFSISFLLLVFLIYVSLPRGAFCCK